MQETVYTIENTSPLSLSQENIWSLEQSFPGTPMNNICATMRIRGRLDVALIQKSLNMVIESDPSLRTRIVLVDGVPRQYSAAHTEVPAPFFDFTMTSQSGFHQWEAAVTRDLMPLIDSPLYFFAIFKLGENDGGLLIKTHHLISDGWSQVLIGNRFSEFYLKFLSAEPGQYAEITADPAPSYQNHLETEQKYLASAAYGRDRSFWEEKLSGRPEPAAIKDCISASVSPVGQRKTFSLSELLNHAIFRFCSTHRVAPFSVVYMALAVYLNRISGQDKLCIGVPIFNRTNYAEKLTTGMFVSTLPFINQIDENWTFSEFNQHLTEQWFSLLKHQRFPFPRMMELAKKLSPEQNKLFHIVLSYQNSKLNASDNASVSFSGDWHYSGYQAEHLCIHLSHLEDEHRYTISYDYLAQIFSEQEICSLHHYLVNILSEALANPDRPLWSYSVIGDEEKERVLFSYNRTSVPRRKETLYQQWSAVLVHHAGRVALIHDGERMTYRELAQRADRCAACLLERFPQEKITAAVLLPKGFGLFAALAGILQSGNAWVLLPPDIPAGRLGEILQDSGAAAVFTSQALRDSYSLPASLCIVMEELTQLPSPVQPVFRPAEPGDLAYIVYTSGSTGKPKGVEITQANLLNFALSMSGYYGHGAVLSLCNTGFDVFVLESAASLLNGRTIVLPTLQEQESPARLAHLVRNYAVGFLAVTPSRLAAFLRNGEFLQALSKLDTIICGGEAFPSELLQLLKLYTRADIYNQYGPSEATVGVSIKRLNRAASITIGKPMENCRMYLLDKHLAPLPSGAFGDLYIGGACVGKGYRNLPELTAGAFFDSPFELGERIYKTGDIGRWTPDGEIILGGRKDQQVKLRGLRIEPQEIAARISMHPQVREAAVRLVEQNGQTVIAAYYTAAGPVTELQLLEFCANYLPSYMIPACLIEVDDIPLTSNGKADLERLPMPAASAPAHGLQSEMQRDIAALFCRILKREGLDAGSDYFLNGGDSLNALELLAELEHEFGVSLRIADMYACRTPARLEERICAAKGIPSASAMKHKLPKAPEQESYPLTPIQQSLYVQSRFDPTGLSYNMPGAFRLPAAVDQQRLEAALCRLVESEPLLRTCFVMEGAAVVQKPLSQVPFAVERIDAPDFSQACEQFLRPFDLSKAPLFRAAFWQEDSGHCVLLIDLHHIICDGISSPLLLKRLDACYRGELALPEYSYLDYACWKQENQAEAGGLESYWEPLVNTGKEPLELPADHTRPKRFDYLGRKQEFSLSAEESAACDEYCEARGISIFMLFSGVFGILLSKISGCEDFLVGTPVSGRGMQEFWNIFGTFINTLPLRLSPAKELSAAQYLQSVRERTIGMLDHQEISLDRLIALSGAEHTLDRNPLYSVMFSLRPLGADSFSLAGEPLAYLPVATGTAKLDLNLEAAKEGGCYCFLMEYASTLFDTETISLFGRSYREILNSILKDDQTAIYDISAVSPADRRRLIDMPNHLVAPYLNLPIDQLIDGNAELTPECPAVVFHGKTTTYREFQRRSDALAGLLQELGVQRGDTVAFCLRRGADIPIAMTAINKAGAAYLPTAASLPKQRLEYMLKNACAKLILCDESTRLQLEGLCCPVQPVSYDHAPFTPVEGRSGEDIMHILYTSGSTGQPKGVMLRHRNLSNLLPQVEEMLRGIEGNFLCIANPIFDTFITETLYQLALGRTIIMADEEEMMLPWKMAELITRYQVTKLQFTPARLQMCLNNEAFSRAMKEIRFVIVCGEVFQPQLLGQLKRATSAKIITMYGPTEVTVYMTMADLTHTDHITIGKPMPNCRVYALDENQRPVMPTAYGELYIAGECVSAGYAGRPDLTQASYLPDPFFPGQVMYRSGDIGRLRTDGYYDFGGRKDLQVKLNGQRIELDEITGRLLAVPGVKEAATVAIRNTDSSMLLRSFFVFDGTPDTAEIRRQLSLDLPAYMVPSILTPLDTLPHTASGKTDLQRLSHWPDEVPERSAPEKNRPLEEESEPLPEAEILSKKAEEPADQQTDSPEPEENISIPQPEVTPPAAEPLARGGSTEETILCLWQSVLNRTHIEPDVSFFEQGGTSLAALSLLSLYFNHGWTMTLEQFYDHPTAAGQAGLLFPPRQEQEKRENSTAAVRKPKAFTMELPQPSGETAHTAPVITAVKEKPLSAPAAKSCPSGGPVVLLTGATGFLGAHLVRALLERGVSSIICPVRGDDPQRLMQSLSYYFGAAWVQEHQPSLRAVRGDIAQPMLGLDVSLLPKVDYVLHAAADVRHYVSDGSSIHTNTQGTANAISLARLLNAALLHISTISVCGEYLTDKPNLRCIFAENDRDIGQNWQENSYVKGKFLAEQLVFDAAARGLTAKIFRIGRLVGRSSDGLFQRNPQQNTFYSLMRGLMLLDYYPASLETLPIELSAVDECAQAIALLMDAEPEVFHVFNPHTVSLGRLAVQFNHAIQPAEDRLFEQHLASVIARGYGQQLSTLLDLWNRVKQHPMLIFPSAVRTVSELAAHSFVWKEPEAAVLLQSFLQ